MTTYENISVSFSMKKYYVYALYNPFTAECFYVGLTTNLLSRLYSHGSRKHHKNQAKENIVNELRSKGRKPLVEILWTYTCTADCAAKHETEWIEKKRLEGNNLVNILNGGFMPPSQKGRKGTPELTQKLIAASTQKKEVFQYDKSGELVSKFVGVREACRATGIDHRSISQVAAGSKIRKTAGGYVWKYT